MALYLQLEASYAIANVEETPYFSLSLRNNAKEPSPCLNEGFKQAATRMHNDERLFAGVRLFRRIRFSHLESEGVDRRRA